MEQKIILIVLAAGASRRMGKPKLFLPLFGSTLLRLAVTAALDLTEGNKVVVVTGAYDAEIRDHLPGNDRIVFVYNPDWDSGMASSLAVGIGAASALHPTHYFITLADQPTTGAESLAFLANESLRWPGRIVATAYPERLGVPAIFPASFTQDLTGGDGAYGARQLIARAGDQVRSITFNEPPPDVDTPEDYERLIR